MGCDIHVIVESKNDDGSWVCLNPIINEFKTSAKKILEFDVGRDYSFFARLCNVRNYHGIKPFMEEGNDLPEDCSDDAKSFVEYWGGDMHNVGHVTLRDFIDLMREVWRSYSDSRSEMDDYEFIDWMTDSKCKWAEEDLEIDKYRVIFGFDN